MKTIRFVNLMRPKFNLIPMLTLLGVLIFTSCQKDEEMPIDMNVDKNLVEVAQEAGEFNTLIAAAQKAGLDGFLSTESNITVFAPTDDAFEMLLSDLGLTSLDQIDAQTLGDILKYHVVKGMAYSSSLSSGVVSSLNTKSPDSEPLSILINVADGVMVNNAKVTTADVMSDNGLIHVIDKVLLPPTVVDFATFSPDFSALVSAVVKADLAGTLSAEGPYTVFAPTNSAFSSLFAALGISGIDDVPVETLTSILTYHVVGDNVRSTELSSGTVTAVSGESFDVDLGDQVVLNGSIKVTATDIQATNGVIHLIDAVLVPPTNKSSTIADIAASNSDFSILVEALSKAGLVEAVANPEAELTVFAPTNDAFANLLQDLGANSLDDIPMETLTSVLLYHVVGGKYSSSDLYTGYFPSLSSFAENNISMYVKVDGGVSINNNAMVTTADIMADNGVIHVIDKVILPPSVVNIALSNENFTTLVAAVVKAGLVDALSGSGPFTVFAPTNDAFDALFAELGVSGIDDLSAEALAPILKYHVVNGNVLSSALAPGNVGTLLEGKSLDVDLSNGVKINQSSVIAPDIQGANGVVHVIDKVMIPE